MPAVQESPPGVSLPLKVTAVACTVTTGILAILKRWKYSAATAVPGAITGGMVLHRTLKDRNVEPIKIKDRGYTDKGAQLGSKLLAFLEKADDAEGVEERLATLEKPTDAQLREFFLDEFVTVLAKRVRDYDHPELPASLLEAPDMNTSFLLRADEGRINMPAASRDEMETQMQVALGIKQHNPFVEDNLVAIRSRFNQLIGLDFLDHNPQFRICIEDENAWDNPLDLLNVQPKIVDVELTYEFSGAHAQIVFEGAIVWTDMTGTREEPVFKAGMTVVQDVSLKTQANEDVVFLAPVYALELLDDDV